MRPGKTLLIVDMRLVIEEYIAHKGMYGVFVKFSLADIIETILSVNPYIDYSEAMYDALDRRFGDDDFCLDMSAFTIFYESLIEDIDQAIVEQYKMHLLAIKNEAYVFERWVDKTSVLLRLE